MAGLYRLLTPRGPLYYYTKDNGILQLYVDYKGFYVLIKVKYFLKINLRDIFHRSGLIPETIGKRFSALNTDILNIWLYFLALLMR